MALANISPVSPFDVNNFTAGARTTSGYARTLSPSLDVAYGESMRGIYHTDFSRIARRILASYPQFDDKFKWDDCNEHRCR